MRKTLTALTLAFALSGCAIIEKSAATYFLAHYVGVWTKAGATEEQEAIDSASCLVGIQPYDEAKYRACMTAKGWVLTPFKLS